MYKEIYEKDLVYQSLVDNYIKASIEYDKKQMKARKNESIDCSEMVKHLNALYKYEEKIKDEQCLNFVKSLKITDDDISQMIRKGVLDYDIIKEILIFKGILKGDENE